MDAYNNQVFLSHGHVHVEEKKSGPSQAIQESTERGEWLGSGQKRTVIYVEGQMSCTALHLHSADQQAVGAERVITPTENQQLSGILSSSSAL